MEDKYESLAAKIPLFRLPFLRGIFAFVEDKYESESNIGMWGVQTEELQYRKK